MRIALLLASLLLVARSALAWSPACVQAPDLACVAGDTFTGDVGIDNEKKLILYEADGNGSNAVEHKAPAALTNDTTFVWFDGNATCDAGEVLEVASAAAGLVTLECDADDGASQNLFETIDAPQGTDPVADSPTDTLVLAEGEGMDITGDSGTDTVTVACETATTSNLGCAAFYSGHFTVVSGIGIIKDDALTYDFFNYTFSRAGNPGTGARECFWSSALGGGGILCEGSGSPDTNEQMYAFPTINTDADYWIAVDSSEVREIDGDGLTISSYTLNFDGGASPSGDLGGTWASPTVDNTKCTGTDEYLDGLGNCDTITGMTSFDITDTDASPILTVNNGEQIQYIGAGTVTVVAAADGSNHDVTITGSAHTVDTGPSPDCSGTSTYQDGEGSCDTVGGDISGGLDAVQVDDVQTATANTEAADNNTTQVATTAFVQQEINGAGGSGLACSSGSCATASTEAAFLADGGTTDLTCGASNQGKAQVMDSGDVQVCDGATTSLLRRLPDAIYRHGGNESSNNFTYAGQGTGSCSGDVCRGGVCTGTTPNGTCTLTPNSDAWSYNAVAASGYSAYVAEFSSFTVTGGTITLNTSGGFLPSGMLAVIRVRGNVTITDDASSDILFNFSGFGAAASAGGGTIQASTAGNNGGVGTLLQAGLGGASGSDTATAGENARLTGLELFLRAGYPVPMGTGGGNHKSSTNSPAQGVNVIGNALHNWVGATGGGGGGCGASPSGTVGAGGRGGGALIFEVGGTFTCTESDADVEFNFAGANGSSAGGAGGGGGGLLVLARAYGTNNCTDSTAINNSGGSAASAATGCQPSKAGGNGGNMFFTVPR